MAKGSQVVFVRFPPELLAEMETAVGRANQHVTGEPYTVSSWVRACVKEKLAHLARAKKRKGKVVQ